MRLDDTFRRSFTNNYGTSEISSLLQQDLDDLSKKYSHCIFDRICISEELYNKTGGIRGIVHAATGNIIDVKVSFALYGLEYRIYFSHDDEAKHYEDIFGVRHAVNTNLKKMWLSTASAFNDDWFSKELREKMDAAVERAKRGDCFDALRYCMNDVLVTQELCKRMEENMRPRLRIKNVIFNDPATIVFWYDGTKTVVKCQPGDTFDPEKGLAMAICKKVLGYNESQSNFNDIFKKWLPKEEEKKEPTVIGKILDMIMTDKGLVVKGEITDPKFSSSINESLGILGE